MSTTETRLDLLAVIVTEAPDAAAGDKTALATLCQAAYELGLGLAPGTDQHAWRQHPGGVLAPRYAAARESLGASA